MKIAIWHNLPSGGGKRALYHHVRGLLARGHAVEAWCPPTADREYLPIAALCPEHVVPLDFLPDGETRFPWAYHKTVSRLRAMDAHCRACAPPIAAGGFDVLLAASCQYFRAVPIGKYAGMPKVLYVQEPCRPLYESLPDLPWLSFRRRMTRESRLEYAGNWIRNALEVEGLRVQVRAEVESARAMDLVLVNSMFSRESVWRAYGLDSRVCYLGVETELFRPLGLPRKHQVMGLGAFVPEKKIGFVIQSLARMPPPRPALVWVGNVAIPSYLERMRAIARETEVEFAPYTGIADEEVVRLLNESVCLVYAPRLEPFGFAPLEAFACGTPVVALAEGGVRETVEDGRSGLLVGDADPQAFADALRRLVENPALATDMGRAARALAMEKWTWAAAVSRLETALASAVLRNARPVPILEASVIRGQS